MGLQKQGGGGEGESVGGIRVRVNERGGVKKGVGGGRAKEGRGLAAAARSEDIGELG